MEENKHLTNAAQLGISQADDAGMTMEDVVCAQDETPTDYESTEQTN